MAGLVLMVLWKLVALAQAWSASKLVLVSRAGIVS